MTFAVVGDGDSSSSSSSGRLARADKAHLAIEDVEELRKFIKPHAPQPYPYRRNALIAGFCPTDGASAGCTDIVLNLYKVNGLPNQPLRCWE